MAIALRGTAQPSAYTTSTSVDFTTPAGLAAGDLILATFYLGAAKTITAPSGFVALASALTMTGTPSNAYRYYSYYKVATGTEGTTLSFTYTGSTDHTGVLVAYSGVDGTTPLDVAATSAAGSSTSISAPTLTPVTANAKLVWLATDWNGVAGTETVTSGFAWQYLVASRDPMLQDATQASAGASGAKAVTIVTAPWAVVMAALRPSSAASANVAAPAAQISAYAPLPAVTGTIAVPTGLSVSANGAGSLGVNFTGVSGADGYQIRYKQTGLTPPSTVTQTSAPPYLARLTDATPGASTNYVQTWNGTGVTVVAIDWGVRPTHNEFTGRTLAGHDMQTPWNTDGINHGTGTMAMSIGVTYGVAKAAGGFEVGGFATDATNLSTAFGYITSFLGGLHAPVFMPFDDADASALTTTMLDSAIAAGLIPILSAGNTHANMDVGSDPWAGRAIRVGASDYQDDTEASFSRYGTAVKLYAPNGSTGTAPNTAGNGSDSATRTEAGTSESVALIAGQVAKILQANPALNFTRVYEMLTTQANLVITTPNQTNQPLLNGTTSPENWTIRDVGSSTSVTHDNLGQLTGWDVQVRTVKGSNYSAWSSTTSGTAGTGSATVTAPAAVAQATSVAPVLAAGATTATPAASPRSNTLAPAVAAAATVVAIAATMSSSTPPPTVAAGVALTPASAPVYASTLTPAVSAGLSAVVVAPAASIALRATSPTVTAGATITAPSVPIQASAPLATVSTGVAAAVSAPAASIRTVAPSPSLPISATIAAVAAVAIVQAAAGFPGNATLRNVALTATAYAPRFVARSRAGRFATTVRAYRFSITPEDS